MLAHLLAEDFVGSHNGGRLRFVGGLHVGDVFGGTVDGQESGFEVFNFLGKAVLGHGVVGVEQGLLGGHELGLQGITHLGAQGLLADAAFQIALRLLHDQLATLVKVWHYQRCRCDNIQLTRGQGFQWHQVELAVQGGEQGFEGLLFLGQSGGLLGVLDFRGHHVQHALLLTGGALDHLQAGAALVAARFPAPPFQVRLGLGAQFGTQLNGNAQRFRTCLQGRHAGNVVAGFDGFFRSQGNQHIVVALQPGDVALEVAQVIGHGTRGHSRRVKPFRELG